MLKQIYIHVLLISFLIQLFGKVVLLADYTLNTAKYEVLCVNKNKPQLHCNGQCALMKKLQKQEKKNQESSERKSGSHGENLFLASSFIDDAFTTYFIAEESPKTGYTVEGKSVHCLLSIFHPPEEV